MLHAKSKIEKRAEHERQEDCLRNCRLLLHALLIVFLGFTSYDSSYEWRASEISTTRGSLTCTVTCVAAVLFACGHTEQPHTPKYSD